MPAALPLLPVRKKCLSGRFVEKHINRPEWVRTRAWFNTRLYRAVPRHSARIGCDIAVR